MGLFGNNLTINIENFNICDKPEGPRYKLVVFLFNVKNKTLMALNLTQSFEAPIVLGLLDTVTNLPVTATFGTPTYSVDNSAVAALDSSNNLEGLAPGTFNLSVSVVASYTDSKNNPQSTTLSGTFPGTVAQATADSVALTVTLGTPVAIPPATPPAS